MRNYKKIEKAIIKYLKDHGVYDEVDFTMVEDLVYNIKLCDLARADIDERGIQVNIRKSEKEIPYFQANQSVGLYNQAIKMVSALATKLGLTVQERAKLNMKLAEKEDELDAILK